MNSNYCVCCGAEIPEGRMVCPQCEIKEVFHMGRCGYIETECEHMVNSLCRASECEDFGRGGRD